MAEARRCGTQGNAVRAPRQPHLRWPRHRTPRRAAPRCATNRRPARRDDLGDNVTDRPSRSGTRQRDCAAGTRQRCDWPNAGVRRFARRSRLRPAGNRDCARTYARGRPNRGRHQHRSRPLAACRGGDRRNAGARPSVPAAGNKSPAWARSARRESDLGVFPRGRGPSMRRILPAASRPWLAPVSRERSPPPTGA